MRKWGSYCDNMFNQIRKVVRKINFEVCKEYNLIHAKMLGISWPTDIQTFGKIRLIIEGNLLIGNGVTLRSGWRENYAGGGQEKCQIVVGDKGKCTIGNNVGISNSTIVCMRDIAIDDNVNIGVNCVIYDTDFHSTRYDLRMNQNDGIIMKPVHICEGAWICGHCIILKGVTIGKHAVIGAGSVVTCNVPEGELWRGNPAVFVRKLE